MKKVLSCVYLYPFIAIISICIGLVTFYNYSLSKLDHDIIIQRLEMAKEDSLLLKSIIEELSLNKKKALIQREVSRFATKKNISHIILVSPDSNIFYANRFHFIGKKISHVLSKSLSHHYKKEMAHNVLHKIHKHDNNLIDVTVKLNYLLNPNNKRISSGYLILAYDISVPLNEKKDELQRELFQIFLVISIITLLLFYIFYKNFIQKIELLESMTADIYRDKENHNKIPVKLASIDTIIERFLQATQDLSIMSRVITEASDAVLITDENKNIVAVNKAFELMSGYLEKDVLGHNPRDVIKSNLMDENFYQKMWENIDTYGKFSGELINRRRDGTSYTVWQNIWSLRDPNTDKITNYVAMSKDISELLQKQKEIEHLAYYDGLTGLVNRSYFLKSLDNMVAQSKRHHQKFALIYIDLDNFKETNDSLGHAAGDIVLQTFAKKTQTKLHQEDTFCRLGGDEFAIILSNVETPDDAFEVGEKVLTFSEKPIPLHNKQVEIGVSIGIALFPDDGEESKRLLSAADLAMYKSKESGKNRCTMFQSHMQDEVNKHIHIRQELKHAIKNNEFILYYQPKYSAKEEKLIGFESLIRWEHPQKGFIMPGEFIKIAEESGLIIDMTEWIFQEVNKQCEVFSAIYKNFSISINISAKHFKEQTLAEQILRLIDQKWIIGGYIELEVTESAIMDEIENTMKQLRKIQDMGITISLDDYGTGYSSLSYLKNLPIDIIKIDKSFVDGICNNKKDFTIVKSTIELAESLGMHTVVEGVEDKQQLDYVRKFGATYIQGYVYSKPLNTEDTIKLLEATVSSL